MEANLPIISDITAAIKQDAKTLASMNIIPQNQQKRQEAGGNPDLTPDEVIKIIQRATIDVRVDVEKPPFCLFIDEQAVLALGDISTIIGRAKSRKTFFLNLIVSALAGNTTIGGRIEGRLSDDKRVVLVIDTEQSRYYGQMSARRNYGVLDKDYTKGELDNLIYISLREYTPAERLEITEYLIYNTKNLGVVLIDGIRDLVTSINDEEQATMITSKLLKWSTDRMVHVCTVLHMNKGDNNARGHIGTELMNKSLSVLSIEMIKNHEDEFSQMLPIATRDREPNPIVFGIDEQAIPYILDDDEVQEIKTANAPIRGKKPDQYSEEEHLTKLRQIFKNVYELSFADFRSVVKDYQNYDCGDNKAKDIIRYLIQNDFVKERKDGRKTMHSLNSDKVCDMG